MPELTDLVKIVSMNHAKFPHDLVRQIETRNNIWLCLVERRKD